MSDETKQRQGELSFCTIGFGISDNDMPLKMRIQRLFQMVKAKRLTPIIKANDEEWIISGINIDLAPGYSFQIDGPEGQIWKVNGQSILNLNLIDGLKLTEEGR